MDGKDKPCIEVDAEIGKFFSGGWGRMTGHGVLLCDAGGMTSEAGPSETGARGVGSP